MLGTEKEIGALNSTGCNKAYQYLLTQQADGRFAAITARDYLADLKAFAGWAEDQGLIEFPQGLRKKTFRLGEVNKVFFEKEEIAKILSAASERTRLYLLLMLNTGCQQTDIAGLTHDKVDWGKKTLARKRSKTGHHANVPSVTYKLWPETFRLLEQFRSEHLERVLLNDDGQPLKSRRTGGTDNIRTAYMRVVKKLGIEKPKPLKALRKTAANELQKEYPQFVDYFLGHSPRDMAGKHYTATDQERFDKAVVWLGQQFLGE